MYASSTSPFLRRLLHSEVEKLFGGVIARSNNHSFVFVDPCFNVSACEACGQPTNKIEGVYPVSSEAIVTHINQPTRKTVYMQGKILSTCMHNRPDTVSMSIPFPLSFPETAPPYGFSEYYSLRQSRVLQNSANWVSLKPAVMMVLSSRFDKPALHIRVRNSRGLTPAAGPNIHT